MDSRIIFQKQAYQLGRGLGQDNKYSRLTVRVERKYERTSVKPGHDTVFSDIL